MSTECVKLKSASLHYLRPGLVLQQSSYGLRIMPGKQFYSTAMRYSVPAITLMWMMWWFGIVGRVVRIR